MSGCCLYCKHAGAGWISTKDGSIHVDRHDDFYKAMNIYCNRNGWSVLPNLVHQVLSF